MSVGRRNFIKAAAAGCMVLMIENLPDRLHAFANNAAHARAAAEQHPILFGYLVGEIIASGGSKGEKAIQEAVRFYGTRRGKRMADKAVKSNFQNDLLGYLLFTEFDVSEVGNVVKIERRKPCLEVGMPQCFWHSVWAREGLLEFGKFYCRDIDKALIKGFNPSVRFEAHDRFSTGTSECRFVYTDWELGLPTLLKYLYKKSGIAKKAGKSWEYHSADLYQAFSVCITRNLGPKGVEAMRRGMIRFSNRFGAKAARALVRLAETIDFNAP